MHKPGNFEAKIFTEFRSVNDKSFELGEDIGEPYGFTTDYDCGEKFYVGRDSIYENLEARVIFLLKRLKEENFKIDRYIITATVYDSNINGYLI